MIEWVTLTSEEIAAVDKRLPVIIPLGLLEAHGTHHLLRVDVECGAYFARRVAEVSGEILAPVMPYGFADEMREYPGNIGLKAETLTHVIADVAESFCFHGFTRQILLSGHGANRMPVEMAIQRVWQNYRALRATYWNYWSGADLSGIHHAAQGETEIAMAVGLPVTMDRGKDCKVSKPWYAIRSRFESDPNSGGVNGRPSLADQENGQRLRDHIVRTLAKKVRHTIHAEQDSVRVLP
jgi:creatinine amidohydrolase